MPDSTSPLKPPGFEAIVDHHAGTGTAHRIGLPIQVYPLYENAFRAARRQSVQENRDESAQLYAAFAQVAEANPMAWSYGKPAKRAAEIGAVSARNRMICFPCQSSA